MNIPEILDDEFVGGYAARIAKVNALEDATQVALALVPPSDRRPTLEVAFARHLAEIGACDAPELLRRHGVVHALMRESQVRNLRKPRHFGWFRPGASHPMLCPVCVASDTARRGFAYWRRSHQLPGIYACNEHSTELLQSPHATFNALTPQDLEHAAQSQFSAEVRTLAANKHVQIALAILRHAADIPLPERNWEEISTERPVRTACAEGLLETLRKAFPTQWMERLMPYAFMCPSGSSTVNRDRITTVGIALVCAIAFDSADAAIDRLYRQPAQFSLFAAT